MGRHHLLSPRPGWAPGGARGPGCGRPGRGGGLGGGAGGRCDGDPGLHCRHLSHQHRTSRLGTFLLVSLETLRRVRDPLPPRLPELLAAASQEPGGQRLLRGGTGPGHTAVVNLQVLGGGGARVSELRAADVDGTGVEAVTSEERRLLRSVSDEFGQVNESGEICVALN